MPPTPAPAADSPLAARAYRRVTLRLIPFLFLCYVVAYLDRVNIGFAKLQMLSDLRMSDTAYGIGAGIFFIGYFLFEVPSNLILHRVGARRWIARIMVTWGVLSMLTMFVTGPWSLYLVRFLLGLAEAGFFPGIVLYLTQWYPSSRRAQIISLFMTGVAISGVIGGPLSGMILEVMAGRGGLAGWQWLFLLEGIPSLVMGVAVFFLLPESITTARWLPEDERRLLLRNLEQEAGGVEHANVFATLRDPRVILFAGISFSFVMGLYGISFWLPQLIRTMGVEDAGRIGLLSGIPSAVAAVFMVLVGWSSDRHRERRWHLVAGAVLGAAGLVAAGNFSTSLTIGLVAMSAAMAGSLSNIALFWTLPTAALRGASAAAGIAAVNSIGNLAGFLSPYIIGVAKDATGSATAGLYVIAVFLLIGAGLVMIATRAAPARPAARLRDTAA
ncbi:MAG: MFS transporter [Gemmatimonadaceae bacterium]|nr:MFS transporter [Gemmatimonadaceae bacterium]